MTTSPPLRLLLVDDEQSVLRSVGGYLQRVGFGVTAVADAADALAEVEAGSFDIVVTDHRMPGMSGTELVEHLLARDPRLHGRLFLATGDPHAEPAVALRERTGCGILAKPFDMAAIAQTLRAAAGAGPPPRELPSAGVQGVKSGR